MKLDTIPVSTDCDTRLRTGGEVSTECDTRLRIDETVGRGSHILTSRVGSDGKSFGWSGTGLVTSVVGWVVVGLIDDFRASKYGVGCSIVVVSDVW